MTETVTLALSELRSLITKAARGAGLSWGLAEEAGWAAEWLARRGMPAADWATAWLAARMDGAVSPVEVGASLADELANTPAIKGKALPDGLVAPGYLLPFLHRIAQASSPVSITSTLGQVVRISIAGDVVFGPSWQLQSDGWRLSIASDAGSQTGITGRPTVSGPVFECLDGLALWTTVPRSDTSRRDAGSSGGDND
jgi:Protein of unknown function (DUF3726)